MTITYRDELGYCAEKIDENGIDIVDGVAYFNDKKIAMENITAIKEEGVNNDSY